MSEKIKLIAETAWHHEGDFEFMMELINNIIKSKADIVKLHITLDLNEYMGEKHPAYKTLKNWMFNKKQWASIFEIIQNSDKDLMLLLNDKKSIEFGMHYSPKFVEIHSVCLNDIHLIDSLKNRLNSNTAIVLGVGGSTIDEIKNAINLLKHPNIILMFGFQNYPTKYEDINFRKTRKIMNLFPQFNFGYADHTAWDEPNNELITLLGAAQGVQYVEKHVTTKYGSERCDWNSAISLKIFDKLAEKLKLVSACQGDGLLNLNKGELDYTIVGPMKKAAHLKTDINLGDLLTKEIIYFKRTNEKSDLSQINILELVGSKFSKNLKQNHCLMKSDIKKL